MTNRMIVGQTDRVVDLSAPSPFNFDASELTFQPIATYLAALHSFTGLAELYKPDADGARPWAADDVALFDGAACDVRLRWSPHHVVVPMLWNAWPARIEFVAFAAEPIPSGTVLSLGVLERYLSGLGQALLTNFFENQKGFLKEVYGKAANWPRIWNFGRVVRNAMAHGGKIRIDDGSVVKWRRLTYSGADNGRAIVNVDLWPADIFVLMKEMEAALVARDT